MRLDSIPVLKTREEFLFCLIGCGGGGVGERSLTTRQKIL